MNNDLISRSEVIALIENKRLQAGKHNLSVEYALADVQEKIGKLNVAYDVDKTAEQLEAKADEAKDEYCSSEGLIKKLRLYAEVYRNPPYGREVEGTPELLEEAALQLQYAANSINAMKRRFIDGIKVHYQGQDADDEIECPLCGHMVAWNDSYDAENPSHCPDCGTKLIY